MNTKLYGHHKDLLNISMKKNNSNEVGFFWNLNNLDEIFVVKGNQKSISLSDTVLRNWIKTAPKYSIHKTELFDPISLMVYYNDGIKNNGEYSGIKNVAKKASKIGIRYKCSIKKMKRDRGGRKALVYRQARISPKLQIAC